jgi:hypothetical protein
MTPRLYRDFDGTGNPVFSQFCPFCRKQIITEEDIINHKIKNSKISFMVAGLCKISAWMSWVGTIVFCFNGNFQAGTVFFILGLMLYGVNWFFIKTFASNPTKAKIILWGSIAAYITMVILNEKFFN